MTRWLAALGSDDEDTLAANNLAAVLWALGDYEPARALDEDTLARTGGCSATIILTPWSRPTIWRPI